MLREFRVENHRSLRDEQVLSMEAGRVGDEADLRPRQVASSLEKLLPVAVLYGANGSGKSNVLSALRFMRDAVFYSQRMWSPEDGIPRDPFAWGPKRDEASLYEVEIVINSVRYQYGFTASDQEFLEEWLYAWPNGRKQIWFERDKSQYAFGDNLKGENRLIEELTRSNSLFLSAAAQNSHVQLTPIYSWFFGLQAINVMGSQPHLDREWSSDFAVTYLVEGDIRRINSLKKSMIKEFPEPFFDRFRSFLRNADIGIMDLKVTKKGESTKDSKHDKQMIFLLKHGSEIDEAWLPLEQESRGTQTLFRMALPVLKALETGGVILIDELEASLHPMLAQQIVRQFNDPLINPRNAQLIITTHDTNLLGTTLGDPALRRDQIWLTEKDKNGSTILYPLTDYKPRKVENLERGYLQGRYGAIPFLGDFRLSGE